MIPLKTVEDAIKYITNYDENVGNMCYPSDVERVLSQDRQAIATALLTALEEMKVRTDAGRNDPAYYHFENTRDGTIDQTITIVKNLLTPTKTLCKHLHTDNKSPVLSEKSK